MITSRDICKALENVDHQLGQCGRDFDVYRDRKNKAWVLDYHNNKYHLATFLDENDVNLCLDDNKCLSVSFETTQLRHNFKKYLKEHALENHS
jgi:hypothetical protein